MTGDSRVQAERLAAQAAELFCHLPVGEILDHADLQVGVDAEWNLRAIVTADARYELRDGGVWRVKQLGEGRVEVVAWKDRREVGRYAGPVTLDPESN